MANVFNPQEFITAIAMISKEKGLDKKILFDAVKAALETAYKKNYSTTQNVRVEINEANGNIAVLALKDIVEEVEDSETEISLEDAKKHDSSYQVGDVYQYEVTPADFGRIAAQNAKQVVFQRIKDAERELIYAEFSEKEKELLTCKIQRVENKTVFVDLDRTEAVLPISEQMPNERYRVNDIIKVIVSKVEKASKGPSITVSRSNADLVKRLFESEVPEIIAGDVIIKSVAREAGYRTKISVAAMRDNIDAIGACVGQRGARVKSIVSELRGEKIDIINYSDKIEEYVASALSPATIMGVLIEEDLHMAKVVVPDDQLSLAIGKEGRNARLAARLTGWKIDIKSYSKYQELSQAEKETANEDINEDENTDLADDEILDEDIESILSDLE